MIIKNIEMLQVSFFMSFKYVSMFIIKKIKTFLSLFDSLEFDTHNDLNSIYVKSVISFMRNEIIDQDHSFPYPRSFPQDSLKNKIFMFQSEHGMILSSSTGMLRHMLLFFKIYF